MLFGYVGGERDHSSKSLKFDESLDVPFFQVFSKGLLTDIWELFAIKSKALLLLLLLPLLISLFLFLPEVKLIYKFLLKIDDEFAKLRLN